MGKKRDLLRIRYDVDDDSCEVISSVKDGEDAAILCDCLIDFLSDNLKEDAERGELIQGTILYAVFESLWECEPLLQKFMETIASGANAKDKITIPVIPNKTQS